jgi:signal transduction histidine kinase
MEPLKKHTAVWLFHAQDDRIWIGFSDGRLAAVSVDGQVLVYNDLGLTGAVAGIAEDPNGVLWVAGGDGIARFDQGKSVAATSRANGFPGGGVVSIVAEPGAVWAGTRTGIVRIERREFDHVAASPNYKVEYKLYDDADGLDGMPIQLAFPNATRTIDNKLWFLTDGGATLVDPAALSQSRQPPRVYIEDVRAGSERFAPAGGFTLPAHTARLELDYTAPTFASPQSVRFRFRLDGFDSDWQDAGSRRQAIYTNLPPGNFRFQVAAIDKEGRSSPGSALAFRIAPAFYQTSWLYAACALAIALAGTAAWRLRMRSVRQRFALVLAERARVGREVHDTLLQSLVAVAVETGAIAQKLRSPDNGDVRQHLMRLRKDVEEQIRETRQSIWKLRAPALDREDLAATLQRTGERLTQHTPTRFRFAVTGRAHRCSSAVEEQLLRIGQEAMTNALRHADAREISLELHYAPETITLSVRDDGVGFEPDAISAAFGLHLGLLGMQERAEQAGGRVSVTSGPGRGTDIVATFPVSDETEAA